MKKIIFILMFGLFSPLLAAAEKCKNERDILGATYLVEKKDKLTGNIKTAEKINFWRMSDKQVAYQYTQQQMTEEWTLASNGRIRPIRYFDKDERGIEYQPEDINGGKGDKNWQAKYQILGASAFNDMTLIENKGSACKHVNIYQSDDKHKQITWLTSYDLPQSLVVDSKKQQITWTLQNLVFDKQTVQAVFQSRSNYYLTDYADIGDNESDPFLRKMINLGFIGHGASGFYNAEGQSLKSTQQHSH